jgi:cellulose synthase/poly-beta-1,6-N-acetylglucosamine synthase-like glycosyltransferase
MNSARPLVSVIIPHYSDLRGLELCLRALDAQTYGRERIQIIVADNASPEGAVRIAEVINGRAELVVVEDRGAGPARNGGAARARGEIFAFTDSDCVPDPAWIEEGIAALANFDFVGGRVTVLVDDEAAMTAVEAFERVFAFDFKTYIEKKGFTGAGNLFCSSALFGKVGGFKAGLSEDVEWSRRAVAAGYRLGYAPHAIVGHPARRTWPELTRKWRRLNQETFALSTGQRLRRLKWLIRSLALPASAIVHTPRVLKSQDLLSTGQRAQAVCTLFRIRLWRLGHAIALLLTSSSFRATGPGGGPQLTAEVRPSAP